MRQFAASRTCCSIAGSLRLQLVELSTRGASGRTDMWTAARGGLRREGCGQRIRCPQTRTEGCAIFLHWRAPSLDPERRALEAFDSLVCSLHLNTRAKHVRKERPLEISPGHQRPSREDRSHRRPESIPQQRRQLARQAKRRWNEQIEERKIRMFSNYRSVPVPRPT